MGKGCRPETGPIHIRTETGPDRFDHGIKQRKPKSVREANTIMYSTFFPTKNQSEYLIPQTEIFKSQKWKQSEDWGLRTCVRGFEPSTPTRDRSTVAQKLNKKNYFHTFVTGVGCDAVWSLAGRLRDADATEARERQSRWDSAVGSRWDTNNVAEQKKEVAKRAKAEEARGETRKQKWRKKGKTAGVRRKWETERPEARKKREPQKARN